VLAVWVAALALLLLLVARSATRIPYLDDYMHAHLVADPFGVPLEHYWRQHNEHRIPLPRVLFVAAVKLAGNDFRAPLYLNVVLLAVASVVLVRAVAGVRGRYAYIDAAIPLLVMNVGQWENLLWGFQVVFFSSSAMALVALATVIHPRFAASIWRVAVVGVITVLLPLCGANGLAPTPAFSCLLLYVAGRNLRSREAALRRPGVAALALGLAGFGIIALYFHGLQPSPHHESAKSLATIAVNVANFLGIGFGSVAWAVHGPQYDGIAAHALGMIVVLAATLALLFARLRASEPRATAVAVGCVIWAILCLGLGLAYGRGGMGGVLACNRYSTLAMPLPVTVYVAWAALGRGAIGRVVPALLFLAAVAGLWSNAATACAVGTKQRNEQARIDFAIRNDVPLSFVIDRHFEPKDRDFYRGVFGTLRDSRVAPFTQLAADPPLDETAVPVRVLRTEGLAESGGFYRATGGQAALVLALPQHQNIYGLKVEYEARAGTDNGLLNLLNWEPGGTTFPPRPGYGVISQLHPTKAGPATTLIFTDRETDALRIDLASPGAAIRIHSLSVLKPRR
jgi:hypothetical protein